MVFTELFSIKWWKYLPFREWRMTSTLTASPANNHSLLVIKTAIWMALWGIWEISRLRWALLWMTQNHPKLIWNGYLTISCTHWSRLRPPNSCQTKQTEVEWVKLVPIWLRPQRQSLASGTSMQHLTWSKMDSWPLPSTHWSRSRPQNSRQTKQTVVKWVKLVHWPKTHVWWTKMMFFELAKGWDQYLSTQDNHLVQGICVLKSNPK